MRLEKGNKLTAIVIIIVVLAAVYYFYFMPKLKLKPPVNGRITSPFGNRTHPITGAKALHNGTDFAVPTGTPLTAPLNGEVLKVYSSSQGGNQLIVKHAGGWLTGYAHLSSVNAKVGDRVKQGQVIAFSGNTGASTGPHLHFTLTNPNGQQVNPEEYINKFLLT